MFWVLIRSASNKHPQYVLLWKNEEEFQEVSLKYSSSTDMNKYTFNVDVLKAPYSSKINIYFIQERFNILIYGIYTIIKCSI